MREKYPRPPSSSVVMSAPVESSSESVASRSFDSQLSVARSPRRRPRARAHAGGACRASLGWNARASAHLHHREEATGAGEAASRGGRGGATPVESECVEQRQQVPVGGRLRFACWSWRLRGGEAAPRPWRGACWIRRSQAKRDLLGVRARAQLLRRAAPGSGRRGTQPPLRRRAISNPSSWQVSSSPRGSGVTFAPSSAASSRR